MNIKMFKPNKCKRGKTVWIPKCLLDELLDIKREDEVYSLNEAQRKLVKYAQVGRELNRLRRWNWSKKKMGGK